MFEVCVGAATIASGFAALVMMILALADRLKNGGPIRKPRSEP
jgi:hypothetical protein